MFSNQFLFLNLLRNMRIKQNDNCSEQFRTISEPFIFHPRIAERQSREILQILQSEVPRKGGQVEFGIKSRWAARIFYMQLKRTGTGA